MMRGEYYAVRRLRLRLYGLLFMLAGLTCLAWIGCASLAAWGR